ncbi:MAG: hypothetical protein GC182_06255 [Rhodopseudomonas sp.]|nr:hypothetical protein [Rhodopseudomonas sp.]
MTSEPLPPATLRTALSPDSDNAAHHVAGDHEVSDGLDGAVPEQPPSPEDRAVIDKVLADNALSDDAFTSARAQPLKPPRRGNLYIPKKLDVAKTDRPDGGSNVTLKQPLPTNWDAKVGADLGFAGNGPDSLRPPPVVLTPPRDDSGVGAAWASVDVASLATVDARIDPNKDQSLIGTTVTRSVPLGGSFAVTLQSRAAVTESYGQTAADATADPRVWSRANTAKFNILPTGTTLAAGLSSNSADPVTHNSLSAEQKLYGNLNVSTAVNDIGETSESRSVSARFKMNW